MSSNIALNVVPTHKYTLECVRPIHEPEFGTLPGIGEKIMIRLTDTMHLAGELIAYNGGKALLQYNGRVFPLADTIYKWALTFVSWQDYFKNLVTTEGRNEMVTQFWKGSAYTASFYVLLTDGTPTFAAGDTLAAHAGWAEVSQYTGNRQALVLGAVAAGAADNSGSKASFAITGTVTAGGAGIATVDTGTGGLLIGGGAFTEGDRPLLNGDTLNVQVDVSIASA